MRRVRREGRVRHQSSTGHGSSTSQAGGARVITPQESVVHAVRLCVVACHWRWSTLWDLDLFFEKRRVGDRWLIW